MLIGSTASQARPRLAGDAGEQEEPAEASVPLEIEAVRVRFERLMALRLVGDEAHDTEVLTHSFPDDARKLGSTTAALIARSDLAAYHAELHWRHAHTMLRYHDLLLNIPMPSHISPEGEEVFRMVLEEGNREVFAELRAEGLVQLRQAAVLDGPWAARAERDLRRLDL